MREINEAWQKDRDAWRNRAFDERARARGLHRRAQQAEALEQAVRKRLDRWLADTPRFSFAGGVLDALDWALCELRVCYDSAARGAAILNELRERNGPYCSRAQAQAVGDLVRERDLLRRFYEVVVASRDDETEGEAAISCDRIHEAEVAVRALHAT